MTSNLNPYVSFDGNAREAMEFYRDALGGELTVSTFGDMGDTGPAAEKVMHAQLSTPAGFLLMASDTPPGMEYRPGQNISVSISGPADDAANLRSYWERLSAGGTVTVPMAKQPWGDEFGACVDRFGISWMVDIGTEDSAG
ncbi:VOC family protein [Actinocatenispora thailandica]|uniref:VOC family protein n=1 Tax=Actinocatenispora thailandica TaxID=227318 RepID=A0A7R7DVX6_9ACTN|nr:VOC family protein [Actinocatenispora thailandica]BCJ38724.1 VOC family protein [Actinocatenispora thailandica]